MNNTYLEVDYARDILQTYRRVNDVPKNKAPFMRTDLQQKNRELENELNTLRERYTLLRNELNNKDEHLARLNHELTERTNDMLQLQEDFENAIYQFSHKKS